MGFSSATASSTTGAGWGAGAFFSWVATGTALSATTGRAFSWATDLALSGCTAGGFSATGAEGTTRPNGVTRRKGLGVVWGLETTAAGGGVVVVLGWATVEVSMSWRLVWLGVTVSWRGSTDFTTAWGRLWSPFKAASTPWYTVENTCCSFWNFTSVFVGWTFTSTVLGRTVRWSTQPGNLPTIFWLR